MLRRGSRYRALWSGQAKACPTSVPDLGGACFSLPCWTDRILALARYRPARRRRHIARHQPVLLHQLAGLSRFGVGVPDAHKLHRAWSRLRHHLRHADAQAAIHQVLLGHHDGPRFRRRPRDGFAVDRLGRVHIHHAPRYAFAFERVRRPRPPPPPPPPPHPPGRDAAPRPPRRHLDGLADLELLIAAVHDRRL